MDCFERDGSRGSLKHSSRRGQRVWGGSSKLVERLEARIVLSTTFYAFVELDTLPGYNASYAPDDVVGASDDGRYMWSDEAAGNLDGGPTFEPFLVADGVVRYLGDIDGLDGTQIGGINSDGLVFAKDIDGVDEGRLFLFDLSGTGGREYLDAAGLDLPPDFDLAAAEPVTITDSGFLIARTTTPFEEGELDHFWSIHGQQVEYMWAGTLVDVNASGMALGYELGPWEEVNLSRGVGEPLLWVPETSSAFGLSGAGFTTISDIDDDGWILGTLGLVVIDAGEPLRVGDRVALWRNGETRTLGYSYSRDSEGVHTFFTTGSRDRDGRFRLTESRAYYFEIDDSSGYTGSSETVFVDPAGDVRFQGAIPEFGTLIPSGSILERTGWWEQVGADEFFAVDPEKMIAVWAEGGVATVWATTSRNEGILYYLDENGAVATDFAVAPSWQRTAVLTNRTSSRVYVVGHEDGRIRHYDPAEDDMFATPGKGSPGIANIAPYMRSDGTPVVAYTVSSGKLYIAYGQSGFSRLSLHLAERGLETPQFVSAMVGFQTRWRAQNIVGLDANGDVQAVWWSPGLRSPLWTTSNLSAITGAPRLVGELAATATPWGGMQIMGTDERGHVMSLWWSPRTGKWQVTDLSTLTEGPALDAGSLTVQTGRWGSITLVAKSTEGDVVTYWWSPAAGWQAESLTVEAGGDVPQIVSSVRYFAATTGEQYVAGTTAAGHVINLYWKPDGNGWQWEDLTALAAG